MDKLRANGWNILILKEKSDLKPNNLALIQRTATGHWCHIQTNTCAPLGPANVCNRQGRRDQSRLYEEPHKIAHMNTYTSTHSHTHVCAPVYLCLPLTQTTCVRAHTEIENPGG